MNTALALLVVVVVLRRGQPLWMVDGQLRLRSLTSMPALWHVALALWAQRWGKQIAAV